MNEDAKLNDFLKERLEAGVSGEPPRLDAILQAASAAAQTRAAARRRFVSLPCISGFRRPRRLRLIR